MSELIMLAEHAPALADAVTKARTRTKDDTIMARIGEHEGRPGFVTVERGGEPKGQGLYEATAILMLSRMR